MRFETLAVHAAHGRRRHRCRRSGDPSLHDVRAGGRRIAPARLPVCTRRESESPALERVLAALEGGAAALAFASGQAATMAVFQSLAPGDHVVRPASTRTTGPKLMEVMFARWGLTMTSVDMRDAER